MSLYSVGKTYSLAAATGALFCAALAPMPAAQPNTAPNVTFVASGKCNSPPVAGTDTFRLAGEPFSISIVANAASQPIQHGPNWAVMSPFKVTGSVHCLLGPTPVSIASAAASIFQLVGPAYDIFTTAFPVKVVGITLTINAQIYLPPGTLTSPLIHPFATVDLEPGNATVVYSNGTDTTTLAVASGTLAATIPFPHNRP